MNLTRGTTRTALTVLVLGGALLAHDVSSAPPAHAAAALEYTVDVSAAVGGVFARSGPHADDTTRTVGYGAYPGETVQLLCGVTDGDPTGQFNNTRWHFVIDLNNRGEGPFWIADHYLDTPNPPDQLPAGEPLCPNESSDPLQAAGASSSGQSSVTPLPCTPFLLIAARGSGNALPGAPYAPDNNSANTIGFTPTLAPIADSLTAYYGTSGITNYSLPYQAAPALALIDGAYGGNESYWQSVTQGEAMLETLLQRQEQACPSQRIFLAGYSQGAEVVGNAISDDPAVDASIAGVVLFGDPRFNPASQTARGDFAPGRPGVLGARPEYPSTIVSLVRSYCSSGDAICSYALPDVPALGAGSSAHYHYPDTMDVTDAAGFLEFLSPSDQVPSNVG